jgi:zinc transport system substrate-binding protein
MRNGVGLLLGFFALMAQSLAAPPKVLVSIAPLHSLVANIMQGVAEPELLVKGAQSPHHFSLTPSQMYKISKADLVIWIGPVLEGFLMKPLASFHKKNCPVIQAKDLTLLKIRGSGCADHCHTEDMGDIDPHIWLDLNNAIAMTDMIVASLSLLDSVHCDLYQKNGIQLKEKLGALQEEVLQEAQPLIGVNFICLHDAFQYYERMVGVHNVGVIASSHSLEPSLKKLVALREILKKNEVRCAFSEPQSQSTLLEKLAREFHLQSGVIDPLGADISPGIHHYFLLLKNINTAFLKCVTHDAKLS